MASGDSYWRKATFKGTDVFVECDSSGNMNVDKGRVPMRYSSTRQKRTMEVGNLTLVGDAIHSSSAASSSQPSSGKRKKPSAELKLRPGSIVAYTDGACSGNPGPAGYGVFIPEGTYAVEMSGFLGDATNNIAELEAIHATLIHLKGETGPIDLVTDSSYSIGVLTKGWKTKANQELIATIRVLVRQTPDLQLHWIKGHAGHAGNEKADELARKAIEVKRRICLSGRSNRTPNSQCCNYCPR